MKPKEKAEELVNKMWIYEIRNENGSWGNAKQSALIAVDLIIDLCWKWAKFDEYRYWNDVAKEIIKL